MPIKSSENPIYIRSLNQLIQELNKKGDDSFYFNNEKNTYQKLWYRGHTNYSYHLIPSLYRYVIDNRISVSDISQKEFLLLEEFATKNYFRFPYKLPENEFLWMAIMQHYRIPTRLLDWSESLIPALFFALEPYFLNREDETTEIPCLWVLKPQELNNCNYLPKKQMDPSAMQGNKRPKQNLSATMRAKAELRNQINLGYLPSILSFEYSTLSIINETLAVTSPYNNERINSQTGTFTLFPSIKGINKKRIYLDYHPQNESFLRKFIFLNPQQISDELKMLGVRRSMYYPEMESASKDIEAVL